MSIEQAAASYVAVKNHERESAIRTIVARCDKPDSGVSPEFSLVSVADAAFLLQQLDAARGPPSTYHQLSAALADTVVTKQAAYGDSFGKSGAVMRILYPEGIPPEKLDDALTIVRVLDKLFRIATDRDALGESPWNDIQGYALLAVARLKQRREANGHG